MIDDQDDDEVDDLVAPTEDVATVLADTADPEATLRAKIPADLFEKYEFYSYRSAATILSENHPKEFSEILEALRGFTITKDIIRKPGGNESDIPKLLNAALRPLGWHETIVQGDLLVKLRWKEPKLKNGQPVMKSGKPVFEPQQRDLRREKYLDGHKIDYVKGRVAFDLEWNSKDQTFDRDLYAFSAFAQCGVIDAAILVTRSATLNPVFRALGPALNSKGNVEMKNGKPRMTLEKYGASTTWMGKLIYRLNAGRNGGCPVLAVGIKPACISDWTTP
jgi:hypothetical protein